MSSKDKQLSTKGWNWGHYQLKEEELEFQVDSKKCFGIKYKDIALSSASGKHEVALEFVQDGAGAGKATVGDILCEMRFHVPNNELDEYREKKEQEREERRKTRNEENKDGEKESDSDDDDDMTAAKLFDAKIHKKANIGQFAGEIVASIPEIPMLIPRGNYSLDFYSNFAKLHGKTHDYKIMFKDINKIFLLQKPDGVHMVYLLHLDQPLRQGLTLHHFIAMNFELEREQKVRINLTEDQIKEKYGTSLNPEIDGKLYDVLSTLFNNLVGIKKIIVPGDFSSSRGAKAIKCSVKAAEGHFYPLKSSIVFIHKPVLYIRHSELKFVEFSRVGQGTAGLSRSFDLTLTKLKDDSQVTFLGIDKEEQKILMAYFKASQVKMRTVDLESNTRHEIGSDDSAAEEKPADGKRIRKTQDVEMDYDDEDSEEDEDFNEDEAGGASASDDGESGEDEQEEKDSESDAGSADSDMIDEEVNKKELAFLQKEIGDTKIEEGRPKRRAAKK